MVGVLASLLNEKIPEINVTNVASGGGVDNAVRVARGEFDFGLTHSALVYEIWHAKGTFAGRGALGRSVTGLVKAYDSPHYFTVLRESGITRMSDLEGRRIAVGPAGSGAQFHSNLILNALRLGGVQEFLAFADAPFALRERRVMAIGTSGAPHASIVELSHTSNIKVLPFSDQEMEILERVMPFYTRGILPKTMYRGLTEDVQVPIVAIYIIANKNVPARIVERIMEVMLDPANRDRLVRGHPLWAQMIPDSQNFEALGPPIHPGARAYFDKRGIR
jgi:TRAP transporter TAXI family solute receptor